MSTTQTVKLRLHLEYEVECPAEMSREEIEYSRASGEWCGDGTLIRELQRHQEKHGCFCKACTFDVVEIEGHPVVPQQVTMAGGKLEKTSIVGGESRTLSLRRDKGRIKFDSCFEPVLDRPLELEDGPPDWYSKDFTMEEAEFLYEALTIMLGR